MAGELLGRRAAAEAARLSEPQKSGGSTAANLHYVRLDFAHFTQTVFHVMATVMAIGAVVAILGLERGVESEDGAPATPEPAPTGRRRTGRA